MLMTRITKAPAKPFTGLPYNRFVYLDVCRDVALFFYDFMLERCLQAAARQRQPQAGAD